MKHFWALPAFLRLAIASQHQFNVFDDVLAHPQYEVIMAEGVLSEDQAQSALDAIASRNSKRSHSTEHHHTEPHPTPQSSLHKIQDESSGDGSSKTEADEDILSYEDMILNDRRYLCSIPRVPDPEIGLNGTHPSPEDEEKELARAANRGWELLKSMDGNCLYFYSGWWSYSFCYGQAVRQFHQLPPGKGIPIYPPVEDKGVEAYVLGRFDDPEGGKSKSLDSASATGPASETGLAKMETKGDVRYMVQHLGGGTTCDLTGSERRIEVQFRCQPNQVDKIALIKETTTCAYLMVIDTPRLCSDVAFLPPQETKPHAIACTPVLPATSIPSYLAAKESSDAAADAEDDRLTQELIDAVNLLETGQIPLRNIHTEVVGNIEIGARKFIPEGKKLEKGVIVGGGKEKFIATIASNDGFIVTDEDLQRMKIKATRKHVEEFKEEVEREAKGRGWKLDVVEVGGHYELRGVIEQRDERANSQQQTEKADSPDGGAKTEEGEKQNEKEEEGSEETYKEEL